VSSDFHKFPSTPHLALLGDLEIRGDKVMSASQRYEFLRHSLVVEEKIDGANLGISFDIDGNVHAQNRGNYLHLPGVGQWKKLMEWLTLHLDSLFENLMDRYVLFGEWCYASHSVIYDRLPDWFLGFDVYDRSAGRFLSTPGRNKLFQKMCIAQVPTLASGRFTLADLQGMISGSRFGPQPTEGLYLRWDQGDWLAQRAKLVRPEFIQSIEPHWSRMTISPNQLQVKING
jgi:hypothetical protein